MIMTRRDQGRFRPLVESAWLAHCSEAVLNPRDRSARDHWYRLELSHAANVTSTKELSSDEQLDAVIDHFRGLAEDPNVSGWSVAQNGVFVKLARKAYSHAAPSLSFMAWLDLFLHDRGLVGSAPNFVAKNKAGYFDRVMSDLAVLANDETWLRRTAEADERRLRYIIRSRLADLDQVTGELHDWSYVLSIWDQARQLPIDMADAPADALLLVLQILDTHLRQKCDEIGIRPKDLPSRQPVGSAVSKPTEVPF